MATGNDQEPPSLLSLRREARTIFGIDPGGYDTGRPDDPAEVYEILASRCGLRAGASVVEIGAGTGLVTRRLVAAGAWVVAVEPDQNMAAHLAAAVSGQVEIFRATFEQAALPQGRFDLAVAATSFHWVDQAAGLPKLGQVIRPGASRRCTPAADRTEAREQRSGTHRVLPLTRTTGFTRTALLQQNTQFGVADPLAQQRSDHAEGGSGASTTDVRRTR